MWILQFYEAKGKVTKRGIIHCFKHQDEDGQEQNPSLYGSPPSSVGKQKNGESLTSPYTQAQQLLYLNDEAASRNPQGGPLLKDLSHLNRVMCVLWRHGLRWDCAIYQDLIESLSPRWEQVKEWLFSWKAHCGAGSRPQWMLINFTG